MAPCDQFPAQLDIIKNLAVEHHLNGAILVMNRLLTSRKIDDAQARVREPNCTINQYACSVRATMMQARDHRLKFRMLRRLVGRYGQNSCDAAHFGKTFMD